MEQIQNCVATSFAILSASGMPQGGMAVFLCTECEQKLVQFHEPAADCNQGWATGFYIETGESVS